MATDYSQVLLNFRLPGNGGWVEQFYRAGRPTDAAMLTAVQNLIDKRRWPLVPIAAIKSFRVSAVTPPHASIHRRVRAGTGIPGVNNKRDQATSGILVQLVTSTGASRNYTIRGCPDEFLNWDENGIEGNPINPSVKGYLDYLAKGTDGWGMKVETTRAGDVGLKTGDTFIIAGGTLQINAPGLGVAKKDRVLLTGLRGYKVGQFRGVFQVTDYADPVLKLRTKRLLDPGFVLEQPCDIRLKNTAFYSFQAFNDYDADGAIAASRKVGREPDSPRGKRSAAK